MAINIDDTIRYTPEQNEQTYKPRILQLLMEKGTMDVNQLVDAMMDVSRANVEAQLAELEEDGLIVCERQDMVPPRVQYVITESGKSMKSLYEMTLEFGKEKRKRGYTLVQNLKEDKELF